ncbi:hypothetical protein F4803DRAFT_557688 [Xylaria telfairii]|nr:hypothetical protein F4803DRAFT_557688 [Xylaria telfairii]
MSSHLNWSAWGVDGSHARGGLFLIIASLLTYVPFCVVARRHQMWRMARRHSSLETMTLEEAHVIKCRLAEREFHRVFSAAMNSVFFKAEAIPSIAKLIARATQRSSSSRAPAKKSRSRPSVTPADLLGRPGASETAAAIDRVNRIHAIYRPSGIMSDADLLYVLSLFALEPGRWVTRFEWRGLTAIERYALATLWKAIGEDLRIPFDALPSSGTGGFRDALHWLAELEDWARHYEAQNRAKTPESVILAERQLDAWTRNVPAFLRRSVRSSIAALIEPGLRQAMGIDSPSAASVFIVESIIRTRKFVRGHLCSPVALAKGYI